VPHLGAAAGGAARPLVFLGARGERSYFALDVSDLDDPLAALPDLRDLEFQDLRQAGSLVDAEDGALLAYARAMMTWHSRAPLLRRLRRAHPNRERRHVRRCTRPECAAEIFPRTDPR
jgi:NAD+ diphosphatase